MDKVKLKSLLSDSFWIMPATPKFIDSGVSYITSKNIKNGVIEFDTAKYVSEEDFLRISKKRPIIKDDILISMIGTLGEAAIVREEYKRFYGQNVYLLRLNDHLLNHKFFLFFLRSLTAIRHLEGQMNQSTQRYLKADHIESLELPSIDIKAQENIVEELSRLDAMIDWKKKQLQEYDQLIKSRFVEMFEEGGYPRKTLAEITELITKGTTPTTLGYSFVNEGVNFVKIENISREGSFLLESINHVTDECHERLKRSQLKEGDILFSIAGAIGRTAVVTGKILPANTNQALSIIRLNKDLDIDSTYIVYALKSPNVVKQYNFNKRGVAQINLSLKNIRETEIPLPPKSLQNQFSVFVNQVEKLKFEVQKSLDEAQTLFDSLMQEYFG